MQDNIIRFTVTRETLPELLTIYYIHLPKKWDNDHDQLMAAHMWDMYYRLEVFRHKLRGQTTARVSMTLSESIAFFQFWSTTDTSPWPLANVLICDIIKKIDQRAKSNVYAG